MLKLKDFQRLQAVAYTANVVSQKLQNRDVSLKANNRKCHTAYQIAAIPMTLSVLESHSLIESLFK